MVVGLRGMGPSLPPAVGLLGNVSSHCRRGSTPKAYPWGFKAKAPSSTGAVYQRRDSHANIITTPNRFIRGWTLRVSTPVTWMSRKDYTTRVAVLRNRSRPKGQAASSQSRSTSKKGSRSGARSKSPRKLLASRKSSSQAGAQREGKNHGTHSPLPWSSRLVPLPLRHRMG